MQFLSELSQPAGKVIFPAPGMGWGVTHMSSEGVSHQSRTLPHRWLKEKLEMTPTNALPLPTGLVGVKGTRLC